MTNSLSRRIFLKTGTAALIAGLLCRLEGAFKNKSINFDSSHDPLTRQIEYQVNLIDGEVIGLVRQID